MAAPWPLIKLGDVAEATPGFAFESELFTDGADDIPLVKGENVGQGRILWEISKRWRASDWARFERYHLQAGDVVVAMDRPWVPAGLKWAPIRVGDPQALLVQRVARIRSSGNRLVQEYLPTVIGSPSFDAYIRPITTGANVPHISARQILDFAFALPPVHVQRQIAEVLCNYDRLIETNLRRIQILEQIARTTYREWFVRLRFPGHEAAEETSSSLGSIPNGWYAVPLGKIAVVNRSQITARTAPPEVHYIDISSVSPGRIDAVTTYAFVDAPSRARRIVVHGDVIWSCVRPNRRSHALVMNPRPNTIASTGFAVLSARAVPYTFLYLATTTDEFVAYLTNHATGAAYPAVTAAMFEQAEIVVPPTPLLEQFAAVTIPMAEQADVLQRQAANLRATRDLLLPRLMSGQLTLPEAEEAAPASL